MALNVLRSQYDTAVLDNGEGLLQLPWFSDQYLQWYTIQGLPAPGWAVSQDWRTNVTVANKLAVADMTFAQTLNINTGGTNWDVQPKSGVEYQIRSKLAQIGFKPDGNAFVKGGLIHNLTFSRTQDLEGLTAFRSMPWTLDPLVLSHVVPYVMGTLTPGAATVNIPAALGMINVQGMMLPTPWPRTLNALRVWNRTTNRKHWPRGSYIPSITLSGPRFCPIFTDGTFWLNPIYDSVLCPTVNNIVFAAGFTYEIQVGHVEYLTGQYPVQRWPGYTWKVGDGVTW